MKFYPDHWLGRLGRVLMDLAASAWVAGWAAAGIFVYNTVMTLEVVADGITSTGQTFNSWLSAFKRQVPNNIPVISQFLRDQSTALQHNSGDPLIRLGAQAHETIQHIAIALGLLIALPPIVMVVVSYLTWRLREAREMGGALAFVRSATRNGRTEQARALLAYRAVTNLSFRSIMAVTADPVGDLAARRYDALADEMLRRSGLGWWRLSEPPRPRLRELHQPRLHSGDS